jgi:hypothetical protein
MRSCFALVSASRRIAAQVAWQSISAVRTSPASKAGSPGNRRWHASDVVTAERDDNNENADLSKR